MIVVDASVLIAHFEATDVFHDRATHLLLDSAGEPLAASPITLAEVLVGPARIGKLDVGNAAIRTLAIDVVPLPDDAPTRLAELRANTGLRLPDCCVLLAAEVVGGSIATFDARLAAASAQFGIASRS